MNPNRKKFLSLIVSSLLLFSLIPFTAYADSVPYKDIDDSHWSWPYASWAYENDIMYGVSKDRFAPQEEITRAMAVTILYRLSGEKSSETDVKFDDIAPDAYYTEASAWAQKAGIIKGTSATTFSPDKNIYRQDFAVMLSRYDPYLNGIDYQEPSITEYPGDTDIELWWREGHNMISAYAEDAVNWAVDNFIFNAISRNGKTYCTVSPFSYLTRGEIAAMTKRYTEKDTAVRPKLFAIDPDEVEEIIAQDGNGNRITHTNPEDIKAIVDKLNGFEYKKRSTKRRSVGNRYNLTIKYKSGESDGYALSGNSVVDFDFVYHYNDTDNPDDYFTQEWFNQWYPVYPTTP